MADQLDPIRETANWLRVLASNGPDLTVNAHKKAAHEAVELASNPTLEEMADVIICLVGTALHHGWTFGQVMDAVHYKTAVNRARQWAQEPDGTWQHV